MTEISLKRYQFDNAPNVSHLNRLPRNESEMSNRKLLMQRLHNSYKRDDSLQKYECFYCNAPADGADHVPALSVAEHHPEYERILVRCCSSCNNILGNRVLLTLEDRVEYLQFRYRQRWHKDLDMPTWTRDEMAELKGSLKHSIMIGMKRKERAENVLKNLERLMELLQGSIDVR